MVYLDNSATTKPWDSVISAMNKAMREDYFNPSALYAPAMYVEKEITKTKQLISQSLKAKDAQVIFTSGGTESNNLAILGYLETVHESGEVLYTAAEHESVKNACEASVRRYQMQCNVIPLLATGIIDVERLAQMLNEKTRLICITQVCNETGAIMPIGEVIALRNKLAPQAKIHVDGVQGYLREKITFNGIDSYAISGHKIHAPKGIGALVAAKDMRFAPQIFGGGQQGNLRSGTENTVGIAGLFAAVTAYPVEKVQDMHALKMSMVKQFQASLPQCQVIAEHSAAGHILTISFPPVRAETLLHAVEADEVYIGNGSACSAKKGKHSSVLTAMKLSTTLIESAVRISLCPDTTQEECDFAVSAIVKQVKLLEKFRRR